MLDIDYYRSHPDLVMDVVDYFKLSTEQTKKSILKFCEAMQEKYCCCADHGMAIQPDRVVGICEALRARNMMARINLDTSYGLNNNYMFCVKDDTVFEENKDSLKHQFNAAVYGTSYIYELFKDRIVPVVHFRDGLQSIGTAFFIGGGLATAKHCLEGADAIAIRGVSGESLKASKVLVSADPELDIAFIPGISNEKPGILVGDARVLDDVLVMGYPKLAGFTDFLTAEKAAVSSVSTMGSVSAFGHQYLTGLKLMLITAKIKGGNSGSPIINERGNVVGIACQIPDYEGDYDDVGYGVAVPAKELLDICDSGVELDMGRTCFIDFEG